MKGRPITEEEFDRMVGVVPAVVASSCSPWDRPAADVAAVVDSWLFILRGLWWSGLRLTEAMLLHWTDPREITVQLDGRYPMFAIDAQADKGRVDRVFPIAPEFAEMLLAVPEDERHGYVFNPLPLSPDYHERLLTPWVSRVITAFGEAAGIKVAEPQGRFRYRAKPELYFDEHGNQIPREPMVKFASAHDLRRAFGARWSFRVMPPVLQQMMRHERLETTMEFYVGRNAEMAAAAIYEAYEQAMAAGATCERAH
jgi:integrase